MGEFPFNIENKKIILYQGALNKGRGIELIIDTIELISSAQINVLPTFQNTGIKLKLINALFFGRFCLVNNQMVLNTGLENLCSIANSKKEFISQIEFLIKKEFTQKQIDERFETLKTFDNELNAKKIIEILN